MSAMNRSVTAGRGTYLRRDGELMVKLHLVYGRDSLDIYLPWAMVEEFVRAWEGNEHELEAGDA